VGAEELLDFTVKEDPLARLVDRFGAAVGKSVFRLTGQLDGIQYR
jgi:hypothetical protein